MDDRIEAVRRSNERYDALVRSMMLVAATAARERQLLQDQRAELKLRSEESATLRVSTGS